MPTATTATRARVSLTPLPSLADAELVRRARDGDDRAFEEIVRRYRAPLIRYSARHVGRDHAEDVTQHALSKAAMHLREDPRPIHLRAWLYRVAHNAAINMRTRKDWDHEQLSPEIDGVPQPPEIAAQRGEVRQVVSDLDRLPERQRTALLLSVFEGLGYDEIAARLDTSPNSVRALLSRARAHLRKAAVAIAPLPLLHGLGRKLWGLVNAAGGEGAAEAGSSVVQAKLMAIAATTVVAGAATIGRANSQDPEPASSGSSAVQAQPAAASAPAIPLRPDTPIADTEAGRSPSPPARDDGPAGEPEAPAAEVPLAKEPVAAPSPAPPVEEAPPSAPPADPGAPKNEPGPPPVEEPPPDGNNPPPSGDPFAGQGTTAQAGFVATR
ncbi:MAG: sigma-70 family RNA polymerase sigma factor [bacterium]